MIYYFIILGIVISYYFYKLNLRLFFITNLLDKLNKKIQSHLIYYAYKPHAYQYIDKFDIYNIDSYSDSILTNNNNIETNNDIIYIRL